MFDFCATMLCLRTTPGGPGATAPAHGCHNSGLGEANCYGAPVIEALRRFLFGPAADPRQPRVPRGQRVYAVGDVHGRLDLFEALREAIERDIAAAPGIRSTVVLLGDLIDRGPDSAGVVAAARAWSEARPLHILLGNHEEMFLKSFNDAEVLRHFLRRGGRETLLSYGISKKKYAAATLPELQKLANKQVPQADRTFIAGFEAMVAVGDFVFVHAGIAPGGCR